MNWLFSRLCAGLVGLCTLLSGPAESLVRAQVAEKQVPVAAEPTWSLQDQDRIVLLGSTFIERENAFGMIETTLRLTHPGLNFSVRNLGWSGDNVLGESRAYFGPVQAGYAHLQEYVKLLEPTVLLVSYGHNAAFEGADGLPEFLKNYEKLLTDLKAENRRLIVLGTTPLEPIYVPEAQVERDNQNRQLYNEKIATLCQKLQIPFVNLFQSVQALQQTLGGGQLTENGVHLNEQGYLVVSEVLARSLGKSLADQQQLLLSESQFRALSAPLHQKILWKNELFFHRFRPQNETYLRGFRKHEQGQNAKEIYEFDGLVQQEESQLQPLSQKIMTEWKGKL